MFTKEELEAMRLADEEIDREFEETEEEIREAELRDGNLHAERSRDKWERIRERRRAYYQRNKERLTAQSRAYYQSHKAEHAARKKAYYEQHKGEYRQREMAKKKHFRETLPEEITTVLCRFWKENKISRDTFAQNIGVASCTAREWGYRLYKPNTKKIRAVYPELADELDRIMEGAS